MVYHNFGTSYLETTDAIEDRDIERGSGDHNEVRSFTCGGECSWYEPNSSTTGELDDLVARH